MYQVPGTVPSVVLDVGTHTVKAGISGEDLPHVLLPTALKCGKRDPADIAAMRDPDVSFFSQVHLPDILTRHPLKNVDIVSPIGSDGLIENWTQFEALVSQTLRSSLHLADFEHAILYAEPNHNKKASRERLVELFFEAFNAPAAYLAKSAVLAAYASGRTTGIVLDMGHSGMCAVPVLEGYMVKDSFLRTSIGGAAVTSALSGQLSQKGIEVRPLWSFKKTVERADDGTIVKSSVDPVSVTDISESYKNFAVQRLLEEAKSGICRSYDSPKRDMAQTSVLESTCELPDGNVISMAAEKYSAAETTIFGMLPHVAVGSSSDTRLSYVQQLVNKVGPNGLPVGGSHLASSHGADRLVLDAIQRCDASTHRDMYAGVCLTGGTSDMRGVYERLTSALAETYHRVRVLAATGSMERKYCAWTGGSILGTFSEFQNMWFSKSEYDENGASFVHKRCT